MEQSEHGERPVPDLRVGDVERRTAMAALDAHLGAGRLSVEEYGDRSAAASTAVHRGDLAALFVDLPAPHPSLPRRAGDPVVPAPAPVAGEVVAIDHAAPVPHPHPVLGLALGLGIMALFLVPAILGAVTAGGLAPGAALVLPLLFVALGGVGGVARRHGRGPGHGSRD